MAMNTRDSSKQRGMGGGFLCESGRHSAFSTDCILDSVTIGMSACGFIDFPGEALRRVLPPPGFLLQTGRPEVHSTLGSLAMDAAICSSVGISSDISPSLYF